MQLDCLLKRNETGDEYCTYIPPESMRFLMNEACWWSEYRKLVPPCGGNYGGISPPTIPSFDTATNTERFSADVYCVLLLEGAIQANDSGESKAMCTEFMPASDRPDLNFYYPYACGLELYRKHVPMCKGVLRDYNKEHLQQFLSTMESDYCNFTPTIHPQTNNVSLFYFQSHRFSPPSHPAT